MHGSSVKGNPFRTEKVQSRVCRDYSVTINPQLETHCQLIPLTEDIMRNLRGGYSFTRVDLADAYNQIKLTQETKPVTSVGKFGWSNLLKLIKCIQY